MTSDALERLRRVLAPSAGSAEGAALDLQAVAEAEAALGIRLPPDYLEFLAVYGGGSLDDFLAIAAPAKAPGHRYSSSIVEITGTFRRAAAKPRNAEILGDGESYIHWGMDEGGVYYLWRIEGESSADWPVCLYDAGELTVLPFGIVEFLARACTGGLPDKLQRRFGKGGHEFLHWQDEYRRDTERYDSGSYNGG
ncbi:MULTISPECIES: SMI1/KNR4 family protein [Kitasatospora]|uniref:SMI1/KNR4 family protein n=1 Tax=Kitasatospora cathayae TaxID=3004092 RepID=A0ABY7QG16_9ACTN|nr:SMI1/KNR4 family protein [Kitasatospora sp. HUAS 3-15]WBP91071.1 SMI1/KNR4 family protein [Kitasatospora sp. HUAS 3-15]